MLIAYWLIRHRPGLRRPEQIRCDSHEDRMRRLRECRKMYPDAIYYELDVYKDGSISMCQPPEES